MSIVSAGLSIKSLLEEEFRLRNPSLSDFDFMLANGNKLDDKLDKAVTLYLYRVCVDPVQRHVELPRDADDRAAGRTRLSLSLELKFLLTVWAMDAEMEHFVLGECMSILDQHAILAGDGIHTKYPIDPDLTLKVTPDSLSNEDLLRLWDGLPAHYRLSVPYVVRTSRVSSRERQDRPHVLQHVSHWTPEGG